MKKEKTKYEEKKYLENGKINSFEILFGKNKPLVHTPVKARATETGKE